MIAVFISAVLLVKMQNTRYHELGLLSGLAIMFSAILTGIAAAVSALLQVDFQIEPAEALRK